MIVPGRLAGIPKADLHLHAEAGPRLQRLLAESKGESPYDWQDWATCLRRDTAPGIARLEKLATLLISPEEEADPDNFRARIVAVLEEEVNFGAIYGEVRFGRETVLRPDFISLFREAESEVRREHPGFFAEPLATSLLQDDPEQVDKLLQGCLRAAAQGLAGVDLIPIPYDREADWSDAYRWTGKLSDAGLGLTIHAPEFYVANLEAALKAPEAKRLGHAVFAATDQKLLDLVVASGVGVEVCLSSNLILGAVETIDHHPITRSIEAEIPISINTDDPMHFQTNIGREYEIAHTLGLDEDTLREITRSAIRHSFTSTYRRDQLLKSIG